jgi:tRNA threonylcarbamoyladenosine biosynthesis protein TsaB
MSTLIIETSTERSMIAVVKGSTVIEHIPFPFGLSQSSLAVPQIEKSLQILNLPLSDFSLIVVGIGPGSYTGMRVGAAVAKTISYAKKIPLVGISTLQAFIPAMDGEFVTLIDAKIGGVYFIKGTKHGDSVTYQTEPELVLAEHLEKRLQGIEIWVTPSVKPLQKRFPFATKESQAWHERGPDPLHMKNRALKKYEMGEYSIRGELSLEYLRQSW